MDLTAFAFKKRQFTLMVIALLVFSGAVSYLYMPRSEDPGYIVRGAQVITKMPGASPERMEMLVTDKLEKAIQEMPELDYMKSESKTGISVITVNILESYTNMRPIWDKLRRKVEDAEGELPETAEKPVVEDEYGDTFGIVLAINWDGFSYADIKEIADDIRDELLLLSLVAKVDLYGVQAERVFIDYSNSKLAEVGLSPDQLAQILTKRNIINSGGIVDTPHERLAIEPTGNFESVEIIQRTLIQVPDTKQIVALGDITDVYRGYIDPPTSKMRINGLPAIGMAVSMRDAGNIVKLGEEVRGLLDRLLEHYPIGIEFEILAFQPDRVTTKISQFMSNLLQAIVIVTAVMLIFLGLRTGLVVASLIPVTMAITILIMQLMGIGLDQVSLAALMIALGMLVDNAIVMTESVLVELKAGSKPIDAALNSARELKTSLLISSLTTAAAFLPIYLAESQTGEYTAALFKVVTATLLVSWTIALTLIPILCVKYLRVEPNEGNEDDDLDSPIYKKFRTLLVGVLRRPVLTMSMMGLAFVLAIFGLGYVPSIFFPPSDDPMFSGEYDLPTSAPIEWSESVIEQIDAFVEEELLVGPERPRGITSWGEYIGNGGPRYKLQHDPEPPNPYYTFALYNATDFESVEWAVEKLNNFVFERFPDLRAFIRPMQNGTSVKYPIEVRISGSDTKKLFDIAADVKARLEEIPGTRTVVEDWGVQTKKVVVNIDEARAQRANVTNEDVAVSLEAAISGVPLTQYREDDKLIPVMMRSFASRNQERIGSETFNVYSQKTGLSVPMEQVADVSVVFEPSQVLRRDRKRTITVQAMLAPGVTATEVNAQIAPWIEEASRGWPFGFRWELGGEAFSSGRASDSIVAKLPLAGLCIIMLLMAQFNSIKKTLIILITIPLSIIGVTIGLLVTDNFFGFMTFLGVISLAGIVINNAIVLIDRIQIEIDENGCSPSHAVVMAAQRRMRPILLTTITTIMGMIPLWMGGGSMWETMAIAIIFGLMVSTILTLGVVPVLYSLMYRVRFDDYDYSKAVKEFA